MNLDAMSVEEAVAVMNAQDARAVEAVQAVRADVAKAIELVVSAFQKGGRLIYVGAGTSGRLGVLDASECPPTFRADPEMVQGIIAGGEDAMFRAKEGAEDSPEQGAQAIDSKNVGPNDVVMGMKRPAGRRRSVHRLPLKRAIEPRGQDDFLSPVSPPFQARRRLDVVDPSP